MNRKSLIYIFILCLMLVALNACGRASTTTVSLSSQGEVDIEESSESDENEDADSSSDTEDSSKVEKNKVKKRIISESVWKQGEDRVYQTSEYVYYEDTGLLEAKSNYDTYGEIDNWESYLYETDSNGRVIREEKYFSSPDFSSGPDVTVYEYDGEGRVISETIDTSANYHIQKISEYNDKGQLVKYIENNLNRDHSEISAVRETEYTYDGKLCTKEVYTEGLVGSDNKIIRTTTYTYNSENNKLLSKYVIDSNGEGEETIYEHSTEGELEVITSSTYSIYQNVKNSEPTYAYIYKNKDGNTISRTFIYNGQVNTVDEYEYDEDGYKTKNISGAENGNVMTTYYEYEVISD